VAGLLEREPASTRIIWVENDAAGSGPSLQACLEGVSWPWVFLDPDVDPIPPSGTVGIIRCGENLGFAGGNNLGLRFLERHGFEYAWVLNNDTLLVQGSSADLVEASRNRPGVGLWGCMILEDGKAPHLGGIIQTRNFANTLATTAASLDDPLAYVSGCSLFLPMTALRKTGLIPDDYFLYYEDSSFSFQIRKAGLAISGLEGVAVRHLGSLATGKRSPLMEYYSNRNRWMFISRFFPEHLGRQTWRIWYTLQKYLLRGEFQAAFIQICAFLDFRRGRMGRTDRGFSRKGR
jgi:GT2 family glycosyltransferase